MNIDVIQKNNLCKFCEEIKDVKYCGICKCVAYCSVECQKSDWANHKPYCGKENPQKKGTIRISQILSNDPLWLSLIGALLNHFGGGLVCAIVYDGKIEDKKYHMKINVGTENNIIKKDDALSVGLISIDIINLKKDNFQEDGRVLYLNSKFCKNCETGLKENFGFGGFLNWTFPIEIKMSSDINQPYTVTTRINNVVSIFNF